MAQFSEFVIDQGADFSTTLTFTDNATGGLLNIMNYVVTSNAKSSYVSPNVAFSFTCTIADAANGNVTLSLNGTTSANVLAKSYVFDVKAVSPANTKSRIIEGLVIISPSVT